MHSIREFNGKRLRSARLYRAKTISDLSEDIGVSKQAISQFENNKANPSFETLLKIVNILGFPKEFFYEKDKFDIKIGNTYFRALLTTNKKARASQIEKIKILANIYHILNIYLEFPKLNLPNIEFDKMTIEEIALETRKYWGLGEQPIPNLVRVLEKNGLVITSLYNDDMSIDAFNQRQEIDNQEYYFIILSNNKQSAVRRQFDLAHELGHILLHEWSLDIEQIGREEFKQMEREANEFAAEFLLPRKSFINELIYPTDLDFYVELKKKWKVSIAAMIIRACQLNVINYNQYQYLMRKMSQKGWRKKEPLDSEIPLQKPILFNKAIEVLMENNIFSGPQIVKELSKNGLTLEPREIEKLLGLEKDTLTDKNSPNTVINIQRRKN